MSNSAATCNGSNLNANWGLAHGNNNGCGNKQQSNSPIVPDPYKAMAKNIPTNNCYPAIRKNPRKARFRAATSGPAQKV
jgi:hypothetical protein